MQKAIEFKNVTKFFGSIIANDDVSFAVEKGSIHALIGENGAGKSTLMSTLFGLYEIDGGSILINNMPIIIKGPNHANKLGISMVHQHFKLIDDYTNLQNIVLGNEVSYRGFIDLKLPEQKIKLIQKKYNLFFDLNQKTGTANVATQQKVEIMKMLYRDADILIFDEPTAVLTPQEIEGLLETLKVFRQKGKTVLFISHKLDEVKAVSDRATVIRHGKVIKTFDSLKNVSFQEISNAMIGSNIVLPKNKGDSNFEKNETIIKFNGVYAKGSKSIKNITFDIKAGEIFAIAGVEGNGQEELESVASGMLKIYKGFILQKPFDNKKLSKKKSFKNIFKYLSKEDKKKFLKIVDPDKKKKFLKNIKLIDSSHMNVSEKKKSGTSYIPGDRHKYGLVLDFTIQDNSILRKLSDSKVNKFGFINKKFVNQYFNEIKEKFDVRGSKNGASMARSLSGGNQQKAMVGREILDENQFLIVVQPTRGLDIGAINNIHSILLEEKKKGKAILLITFELDEALALADNISVMHNGKLSRKIPIKNVNRMKMGLMMAGGKDGS